MRRGFCFLIVLVIQFAPSAYACVEKQETVSQQGIIVEVFPSEYPVTIGQEFSFEIKVINASLEPVRILKDLGPSVLPLAISPNGTIITPNCLIGLLSCDTMSLDSTILLEPSTFYGQTLSADGIFGSTPGVYGFWVSLRLRGCPDWTYVTDGDFESARVLIAVGKS